MVTKQDIDELEKLLKKLKGMVEKLSVLAQNNWKVELDVPISGETITYNIPLAKKQEIIQKAIDDRNALKAKIDSINWSSLN